MTITITSTPADDARILPAFGKMLGLEQDATPDDVTNACVNYIMQTTEGYERQEYTKEFEAPPFEGEQFRKP